MTVDQMSYIVNVLSLIAVGGSWAIFAAAFLYRRGSSDAEHRSREPLSWLGLALQLISYPVSWAGVRSPLFSPFIEGQHGLNIFLQALAGSIAGFSAWLAAMAILQLGKQWSLQARVLRDHALVTSGVYSRVRHPIYTAMLGMLVATGIAVSHWLALGAALILFVAGTKLRIHLEEKLLEESFGADFRQWRSRVPALIPSIKGLSRQKHIVR